MRMLLLIAVAVVILGLLISIDHPSSNTAHRPNEKLEQKRTQQEVSEALRSGKIRVEDLRVSNRTHLFELLGSELSHDREGTALRLQNRSGKKITAFQLTFGIVKVRRELIYDESEWIPPSEIIVFENEAEPELDILGIGILAVMFDDGTSDGTATAIKEIRKYRSGIRIAIQEVLPRLEKALRSETQTLAKAIESLSAEISALPEIRESSFPYDTRLGIHDERWRIVQELQMTERRSSNTMISPEQRQELQQTALSRIVGNCQGIVARLQRS